MCIRSTNSSIEDSLEKLQEEEQPEKERNKILMELS